MATSASQLTQPPPENKVAPRSEERRDIARSEDHIPGMEPWLWVMLSSFLPILVVFFVPRSFSIPLVAAAGVLAVTGFAMLVAQDRRRGRAGR